MTTTSTKNATPLMRHTIGTLLRDRAVMVRGLNQTYVVGDQRFEREVDAQAYADAENAERDEFSQLSVKSRGNARSAMRRFLEREAQRPVSMVSMGDTVIYELE